jgi:regulator of protease activity HflC (stomatin/prohibitin superfamily)
MIDKLIELLVTCWKFFQFCYVLNSYEQAVVLRWGKLNRIASPGWRWNWPCAIERVFRHPVVTDTQPLGEQTLTTKDGVTVTVTGVITFCVADVEAVTLRVQGEKEALIDSASGEIGFAVVGADWPELVTEQFWNGVTIKVRRRAKRYGLEIESVRFKNLVRSNALQIFNG